VGTPKTVWIELGVFVLDGKGEETVSVGWNKHGTVVVDGLKLRGRQRAAGSGLLL
jgi:hypothetical protein